jgi:hypothetical protein
MPHLPVSLTTLYDVVFCAGRNDDRAAVGDLMLHSIEKRNAISGFHSDELIQRVSLLADLLFGPKAHKTSWVFFENYLVNKLRRLGSSGTFDETQVTDYEGEFSTSVLGKAETMSSSLQIGVRTDGKLVVSGHGW